MILKKNEKYPQKIIIKKSSKIDRIILPKIESSEAFKSKLDELLFYVYNTNNRHLIIDLKNVSNLNSILNRIDLYTHSIQFLSLFGINDIEIKVNSNIMEKGIKRIIDRIRERDTKLNITYEMINN